MMETLNSQEAVGSLKPGGVVIGAPEEQKRGFAASNRTTGDINSWKERFEGFYSDGRSQSRRRPPRSMLLVEREAGTHTHNRHGSKYK